MDDNNPSLFVKVTAVVSISLTIIGGVGKGLDMRNDHLAECDKTAGQLYDEVRKDNHRQFKSFELEYKNRDEMCDAWTIKQVYNSAKADHESINASKPGRVGNAFLPTDD